MIRKFLIERCSWIFLFLFMMLLIIFISYIDSAIPLGPVLYIAFLFAIIFPIFITIRYHKETKFYKNLEEWDTHLDLTSLATAESPFEKIIEESITNQTNLLKKEASKNRLTLEQEKDELLSWIHEVKTPLTAMHLMIERLDDEIMKAQLTHEWLRIHLLLDQKLHQNRILFIENDLYIEKIDVKALIFKELKALQSWCIQKGIGFDVYLEVTEVYSDGKWLAFIIRQLLTNSVKYSEASDIIIKTFQQNDQTTLEIKDFGRGIDPKDLPRIFDKGFTSTSRHQDNVATGMGLYLAKKAAQPLLLHIDVMSKPETGTTFTLTFPKRNKFHHIASV
ncbi:sensor histidine kinase [Terrilactibacillus sp. BCM23-1]|uniref:histidine kinase n=1 Tax=Terrilactibacillus tamarindi TaxID=2599694 RepID=A0A6N8CPU0_9BACI|nr:sensor histidine kinase [Terrilactibacillus tamarindi]MTT31113.1 sensor histidine kinase [Terrilactibacillus tamarindi]